MFVLVPPTSIKIPFVILRYSRAPATLAAGPESMVRMGFVLKVSMLVTPPSPFMTIRGEVTPMPRIAPSTKFATWSVLGSTLAFITEVSVLISSP